MGAALGHDLLIVAPEDDLLGGAVAASATRRRRRALISPAAEAASTLSVFVDGTRARVTPGAPIFLRSVRIPLDAGRRPGLRHLEVIAQLWAACTLTARPVINRPGRGGLSGEARSLLAVDERRAAVGPAAKEVFSSAPPVLDPQQGWCVQDLGTLDTAVWPEPPSGDGPYRARHMPVTMSYETVVVLDDRAWSNRGDAAVPALGSRSVALVRGLPLQFAAVVWATGEEPDEAVVARIDPWPSTAQVTPCLDELADALCERLLA